MPAHLLQIGGFLFAHRLSNRENTSQKGRSVVGAIDQHTTLDIYFPRYGAAYPGAAQRLLESAPHLLVRAPNLYSRPAQ
jgi:NAD(P)H-dependent FMN reductase